MKLELLCQPNLPLKYSAQFKVIFIPPPNHFNYKAFVKNDIFKRNKNDYEKYIQI